MSSDMAGIAHTLRTQWFFILITVVAPIAGVWFALPAKPVDGSAFVAPPFGSYVEVRVDRIEPLPWTIKTNGRLSGRFSLGWIGDHALLLQTQLTLPRAGVLRGEVHKLSGEPRSWVDQTPDMRKFVYDTIVELQDASDRRWISIGAWGFTGAVMVYWIVLWWRRRHPKAPAASPTMAGPDVWLCMQPPRSAVAVASFMRRRGILIVAGPAALYFFTVMAWVGFWVADLLGFDLLDESLPRMLGKVALGSVVAAPISGLPLAWWMRRRLAALRTVARFGELIDPEAASTTATTWGTRSVVDFWHSFNASHTDLQIGVTIADTRVVYKLRVAGRPAWLEVGSLRVIATREQRYAIVIAPNGKAYVAHRRGKDSSRLRRGGGKLPSARVLPPS